LGEKLMESDRDHAMGHWGEANRSFLEKRGFGRSIEPGVRPAVLVIDLSRTFTDPNSPVGSDLDVVVENTKRILESARKRGVPVFFFTVAFMPDYRDAGLLVLKQPACRTLLLGTPEVEIDDRLAPRDDEPVIVKKAPSAFFGTNLPAMLVSQKIDTLILTGCSSSACVRYSAVDGFSHGYRILVPSDAIGDREIDAHNATLHDLQVKYGEVMTTDDVLAYLDGLDRGEVPERGPKTGASTA
jgi:nicotinamidase-related amidase